MNETDRRSNGCWQEKVRVALDHLIHHRQHGLLIMTQEEEVWVRSKLSDELYEGFMETQTLYFMELLRRWEIPQQKCSPQLLSNMILTTIVTYNSGQRALPFLYSNELESTAHAQAESLILFLEKLMVQSLC